jgi:lysophospholipase
MTALRFHRSWRRWTGRTGRTFCLAALLALPPIISLCRDALSIGETNYQEEFAHNVLPYFETGISGSFRGTEGVDVTWMKFEVEDEKGALVILTGRGESSAKYAEVVYDLRDLRLSIYLMDHLGQGLSGRILADPEKGYVQSFDDYVRDVKTFVDTVVDARPHSVRFLLAHSMGACIATLYAERYQRDFDAIVLSSPMMEIDTAPYPEFIAYALVSIRVALDQGGEYAPDRHGYDPHLPFEGNDVTHSRARFEMNKAMIARRPESALGGPTNRWVMEAMRAGRIARREARRLVVPTLLLQAGEDEVVQSGGQDDLCREAPRCRKIVLAGASHEILMETDRIRDPAFAEIRSFLRSQSGE